MTLLPLIILLMLASSAAGFFYLHSKQTSDLESKLQEAVTAHKLIAVREAGMIHDRAGQRAVWTAIENENKQLKSSISDLESKVDGLNRTISDAQTKQEQLAAEIKQGKAREADLKFNCEQLQYKLSGRPGQLIRRVELNERT